MESAKQKQGYAIEENACIYLQRAGLTLIASNYRCKGGEIDLVMKDGAVLVFVEVRYRKQNDYGGAIESITRGKQRKIIRAAMNYLLEHDLWDKVACRFDVIVAGNVQAAEDNENNSHLNWIRDAFWYKF